MINNYISLIGIFSDIVGTWFLAMSLVKKSLEEIRRESVMAFFNYKVALGTIKQKAEAVMGFCFLVFGFILQGFSYIDAQIKDLKIFHIILIASILIFLGIWFFGSRLQKKLIRNFVKIVIDVESKDSNQIPLDANQINDYLILLNKKFKRKDLVKEFFKKYPNPKELVNEDKRTADDEWHIIHENLWGKLKIELK